jgi:hypothetical protein
LRVVRPSILDQVHALRQRVIRLDRLESLARIGTVTLAMLAVLVAMDWLIRWPVAIRLVLLGLGLILLLQWLARVVARSWLRSPTVQSVAIRMEQVEPQLRGLLASAVDFQIGRDASGSAGTRTVIEHTAAVLERVGLDRHVRMRPAFVAMSACVALMVAWLLWSAGQPQAALIGLRRTVTPWTADRWPALVDLQVDPLPAVVARGRSLPLAVHVRRGDRADLRVRVQSRVTDQAGRVVERSMDLPRQANGSFERALPAEGDRMEIRFTCRDAATDTMTMQVVTPPAIVGGQFTLTPPAHAAGVLPRIDGVVDGPVLVDPGNVLAGSLLELQLTLAVPAAPPTERVQAWSRAVLPGAPPTVELVVDPAQATRWNIRWVVQEGPAWTICPADDRGVPAPEGMVVDLRVRQDTPPSVALIQPESDESVTPSATIPCRVEARDDLQLSMLGWTMQRLQRSGEPQPVSCGEGRQDMHGPEGSMPFQVSLATLEVVPGDTLVIRGMAQDRAVEDGEPRPPVFGEPRRLRVIDVETMQRQVREQASSMRDTIQRLQAAQEQARQETDRGQSTRLQTGLAERIGQMARVSAGMVDRLDRNDLGQTGLREMLEQVERLLEQALRDATDATDALRAAQDREIVDRAQTAVAERLRDARDLLDRDDETLAAQKSTQKLADEIERLRKDLRRASQGTTGRRMEDLSPNERQALEEQASRQRAASEQARELLESMRSTAKASRQQDRVQSAMLEQAAAEGERGQVSERMEEAAERTDRNQSGAADEALAQAAEAVERMRSSLQEDRKARAEDLKRRLMSLQESIRALIAQSQEQVTVLDMARSDPPSAQPTVPNLIRLRGNIDAATAEAQAGQQATRTVAGTLSRAAERTSAAVALLRSDTPDVDVAHGAMVRCTDLLRESLQQVHEAQRQEQARAARQAQQELAKAYRDLATDVRGIREEAVETLPVAGARVDRRGAAAQRAQASALTTIQDRFRQGPKSHELVQSAPAFTGTHDRIDSGMTIAQEQLAGAQGDAGTIWRLDQVADMLQALATALSDPEGEQDPFAQEGDSSGGGGGAGGPPPSGLPPIAELRLVRELQNQLNVRTVALDQMRRQAADVSGELAEIARMQEEVRTLGQDWIDRMQASRPGGAVIKPAPSDGPPPMPIQGRQGPQSAAEAPAAGGSGAATPPSGRTLDELLGIQDPGTSGTTADAQRKRQLERSLKQEDLDDLAKSALESMQLASERIRQDSDAGLGTQRVQARALADLDALLEAAARMQRQDRSSSRSGSRSSSPSPSERQQGSTPDQAEAAQPGAQPQPGEGARSRDGSSDGTMREATELEVAELGEMEEGRSEWGRLPQRVREILMQSRRDRVSALYQQATEAYYRRLAESREP